MEKISILLLSSMIFFLSLTAHAKPDIGIPSNLSPNLWTLNSSTLSKINNIPKISESQSANERLILQIIELVEDGDLIDATQKAKSLIEAAPNYALAQLLYADLLSLQITKNVENLTSERSGAPTVDISAESFAPSPAILAIQQELSLRLKASSNIPPNNSIPKHIITIGNQYRQLLVADTKIGRIFIFDIKQSQKSTTLDLRHSFFMTIGDQGAGKMIEGDKKTPLGIYQLLNRVPQNLITDLYGIGAIQTNYPNPVDRMLGKTGYGIWLHGTPSQVYVRYPLASDGCLVVSNDDMAIILKNTTPQRTLVIIDDGVEWVQISKNRAPNIKHPIYEKLSDSLTTSSGTPLHLSLSQLYEGGFKWEYRLLRLIQTDKSIKKNYNIENISLIEWSKENPYAMIEFDFKLNSETKLYRVRQHWMQKEDGWKIVRESIY